MGCIYTRAPRDMVRAAIVRVGCVPALFFTLALGGCAAVTNPVAVGIPVRNLPSELKGQSREGLQQIPLSLLGQRRLPHRLGAGDVLAVFIEGALPLDRTTPPPVNISERGDLPPAFGYPLPVRENGTLPLPLIGPVKVSGLTIEEAEDVIRKAYIPATLKPDARIIVSLLRPRTSHILVLREDVANVGATNVSVGLFGAGELTSVVNRRSQGFVLDLPAGENDVLNALARSGGLPGTEAINEVIIQRGAAAGLSESETHDRLESLRANPTAARAARGSADTIRIPLRIPPGESPNIRPEDIILRSGDIVYVEAREAELYYTGGLLPPGEHLLPRDFDIDVIEAIIRARGPVVSGGIANNNLSGTTVTSGIGQPSPSLLTVLRRTPDCGLVVIRVDLNRALRDRRERLIVQARDVLILQETPSEALARYASTIFKFNIVYQFIQSSRASGVASVIAP